MNYRKMFLLFLLCPCMLWATGMQYPADEMTENGLPAKVSKDGTLRSPGYHRDLQWKISGIADGEYFLRLRVIKRKNDGNHLNFQRTNLYLNGKRVPFVSGGPIELANGLPSIVLETGKTAVKNGDLISVRNCEEFSELVLSKDNLAFAPIRIRSDRYDIKDMELFWNAGNSKFGDVFHLELKNRLGIPKKAKVRLRIVDFFMKPVGGFEYEGIIEKQLIKDIVYKKGFCDQYRAYLTVESGKDTVFREYFTLNTDCMEGYHKIQWLDHGWKRANVKDNMTLKTRKLQGKVPNKLAWKKVSIPDLIRGNSWNVWYKKTFIVNPKLRGEKYDLVFLRLVGKCNIFLNGKLLDTQGLQDLDHEFRIDVTGMIDFEKENTLMIENARRYDYLSDAELLMKNPILSHTQMLYSLVGRGLAEVFLEAHPAAVPEDIRIDTSFRKKTITVTAEIPRGYTMRNRVLFQGKEVVPYFENKAKWEKPLLWGPVDFSLLQLETVLLKNGKVVDIKNTRFGFREIWSEGMDMVWNGKVIRGVAAAMIPHWGNCTIPLLMQRGIHRIKDHGLIMYHHNISYRTLQDFADEAGILASCTTALTVGGQLTNDTLNCESFWKKKKEKDLRMVKMLGGNHPSLFEWYLSNEAWGQNDKATCRRISEIVNAVNKADPTRYTHTGSDCDMQGAATVMSLHYPLGSIGDNIKAFFPNMYYFRNLDDTYTPGDMVPKGQIKRVANLHGDSLMKWGVKPVFINETGFVQRQGPPHPITRVVGDMAYSGYGDLYFSWAFQNRWYTRGQREMGATFWTPWNTYFLYDHAWLSPRVEVFLLQMYHDFFEGTKVSYDAVLLHDELKKEEVEFFWEIIDRSGKKVAGKSEKYKADFCKTFRPKIRFEAPAAGDYVLTYGVKGYKQESMNIRTFRKSPAKSPYIIAANQPLNKSLLQKAESGANIIILPREEYPEWFPCNLLQSGNVESINFTFRPNHPVLKGLSEEDLSFWYPDQKTGDKYFYKNFGGNARTLIEAGGPGGMVFAALVEIPYGKGSIFLSRLNLDQAQNPVAQILLKNMLEYKPENRFGILGVIANENAPFLPFLNRFGIQYKKAEFGKLNGFAAIMIDGKIPLNAEQMEELRSFKGTVFVREPSAQYGVTLKPIPLPTLWRGRSIRIGYPKETQGITSTDLYMRRLNEVDWFQLTAPGGFVVEAGSKEIHGAQPMTYPVYLAKKDHFVFDTLNWLVADPEFETNAARIIQTLMTNAKVKVITAKRLTVPKKLVFTPIDLGKALDRDMVDEVEDDGKGGFSDQGPDYGYPAFTRKYTNSGVYDFKGIQYRIQRPASCFALKSRHRRGGYDSVSIPVNAKFEWLFLLHTSAWTSFGNNYELKICYDDGTEYTIKMSAPANMHDWSASPETSFIGEQDTITSLAYTERNRRFNHANLYTTAWKNPTPGKKIVRIDFVSMKRAVPVIVALTGANEGMQKIDQKEFEKQAALAYSAEKGKNYRKAILHYEAALRANPRHLATYNALALCYERIGNLPMALETYQKSYDVDFNQPPVSAAIERLRKVLKK